MQTIQINNPEIENFISTRYGNDTQGLLNDFIKFVKLSLNNDYPAISKNEASVRIAKAVEEIKSEKATLLNQKEYDDDINEFLKSL